MLLISRMLASQADMVMLLFENPEMLALIQSHYIP
jgi:hypothetical protein